MEVGSHHNNFLSAMILWKFMFQPDGIDLEYLPSEYLYTCDAFPKLFASNINYHVYLTQFVEDITGDLLNELWVWWVEILPKQFSELVWNY